MKWVILLLVAANGLERCQQAPAPETSIASAKAAPMTDSEKTAVPVFDRFDDLEFLFHQQNDTTYVINLWATWCKPCVEELPYFEQAHEQFKNEKVKIILVSLDFKKMIESKLLPFIQQRNLQSQVLVLTDPDNNTWIPKVDPTWEGAIPATLVYRGNERVFVQEQFADYESLESIIENFANE
jgi:thiol-disulfide isomerase/thioredoxin